MSSDHQALYSQIPAIDTLLRTPTCAALQAQYGSQLVTQTLRSLQQQARHAVQRQQTLPDWCADWGVACTRRLAETLRPALRQVFNLTGTVLHTNLGRALLPDPAIAAAAEAMSAPVTLEYDLDDAGRGHRDRAIADRLCALTGAEDACIVNNNAAAVLLMLAALAPGRDVIVSRGELVEIGGAFRIPDVMIQAGCRLREVGTTNRTHLHDYRQAIDEHSALLMKVHTSNYAIAGFTAAVSEAELAALGHEYGLPVISDLGSGSLLDMAGYGLPAEPMPQRMLADGVDLVSFSGDKLLGGPQAGIIVGRRELIHRLQRHPLKRALRCGKMTLAALDATLQLYQQPEKLRQALPTLRHLTREASEIAACGERLLARLRPRYDEAFILALEPCLSQIGSGSLPVDRLPSHALTLTPRDGRGGTLTALAERWRALPRPVIGRLQEGKLWLDLRCLDDEQALLQELCQ
ncbi:L-seryl-tRNA(Sec) selenium transferase [Edwardsiella anguillarum]|uniref:L-seryl-tRNA(Sec) selenium transferase n=1 Tax=Edwardsiella TaxID=635 RepID=UPI00045D4B9C|nr:L-seryl-tRNA(Sec) selenium transferase [Edwardsiella anguillarum]AKM46783.1 selenocysteine synthase [Edwardsiella sp. EA181011]GAJ68556.1 L-seryl-tRNA(Sec) selenium transferase [Edwardsiella piscicida]RFT03363.1 L-selenocysteinyl-tRNA(Sec) synthase [Edwardsiella anguillarum]WHP79916.1 L-seryl-tRNA(Sec) selenium transferase [Edwardsiella anguillarum]WHQ17376.1 L-seryl-tRNA(Sec) selenium transferase [Edwardsiella anguillarum]